MRQKSGNGHSMSVERLVADIRTLVHDSEELLRAGSVHVKNRAVAGVKSADRTIRAYPYQTLGIVFGLGFLAGLWAVGTFSRSRSR